MNSSRAEVRIRAHVRRPAGSVPRLGHVRNATPPEARKPPDTGSSKLRGATNKLLTSSRMTGRGVVAASSGNHALGGY
jgi:hypothetical protein